MTDLNLEQAGNVCVLTITGRLTDEHAPKLKNALIKAFNNGEHVIFHLEKVTAIDSSCLHIICTAYQTSLKLNKRITLLGTRLEIFSRAINDLKNSCHTDVEKACSWIEQEVIAYGCWPIEKMNNLQALFDHRFSSIHKHPL